MATVSVVYQSRDGHTEVLAQELAQGARSVEGVRVNLVEIRGEQVINGRWEDEGIMKTLEESDAIVFGCATYMGSVASIFKAFLEKASDPWESQSWKDKIAGGFTNSASQNGDKLSTLFQLVVFAMQMNMIWVGVGDPPGNNWSGGSPTDINRLGSWLGAMGQSDEDRAAGPAPNTGDRLTAERYGRRLALVTRKWKGEGDYTTERIGEAEWRRLNQQLSRNAEADARGAGQE